MKRIIHIARNELYSLFYSPIAWLLLILFLILSSVFYMGIAEMYITNTQKGWYMDNLTDTLTVQYPWGFLHNVIKNLYMIFPLITMGLISREKSSGTIKLLLSSPVRIREIVMGKFLAVSCFTFCLLAMVSCTFIDLAISIEHPDYGQMLGTFFGLFIVLSAYAAIGLFISSLTTYQIVAAIITFAILFLLSQAGDLFQDVQFLRHIMYYLNMPGKSLNLIVGLLNLRDICYFLILTGCFLAFTIIRIRSGMESISGWKKLSRYVVVVAIAFVAGFITKSPYINAYFDTTRRHIYTISPQTQNLLARLNEGDLEITGYANLFDNRYKDWSLAGRNALIDNLWEPYVRFKHNIKFDFKYYYNLNPNDDHFNTNKGKSLKEIGEKEAESYRISLDGFQTPEEISRLVNVNQQENCSFFELKYKGKKVILRTLQDQLYWPNEEQIASALKQFLLPPARFAFLDDEIERGPFSQRTRDYNLMLHDLHERFSLANDGFFCDSISLHQKDIPDNLTAFVIADPRTPIAPESLEKIRKYVDAGGNLFLITEPDRKEITKPLLEMLGLSIRDGLLIQSSNKFSSDLVFPSLTDSGTSISPEMKETARIIFRSTKSKVFTMTSPGASALQYTEKNGFRITPLMKTDPALCWNRVAPIGSDSLQMKVESLPTDEKDSFVTAVRMDRTINGKQQRILVTSDADWMTHFALFEGGWDPQRFNLTYIPWALGYLTYGEYPAKTMRSESPDLRYTVTGDSVDPQKLILYWIIPGLLAITASILLIRRKRK